MELNISQSSSKDVEQDDLVMVIAPKQRFEQLGIDLGAQWRREDGTAAGAGRPVFVWRGPEAGANDDLELLETKDFAARMQTSVQNIYQLEEAQKFFSVRPPGRTKGRKFPSFLLDPRLDKDRLRDLVRLFADAAGDGITMNDLLNFLRASQDRLGGRTVLESLLGRLRSSDGEHQIILNTALEELARVSQ